MQSTNAELEQKFLSSRRQAVGASALGALAIAALVALRPDTSSLTDAEQALTGLFWALGMGLALWWTTSILLCLAAEQSGSRLLQRFSSRVAIPMARRMVSGTMALGLVGLPACGTPDNQPEMVLVEAGVTSAVSSTSLRAASSAPAELSALNEALSTPSSTTTPSTTAPTTTAPASTAPTSTVPASTVQPPTTQPATGQTSTTPQPVMADVDPSLAFSDAPVPNSDERATTQLPGQYTVQEGDNLWSIAKAHLEDADRNPTNAQIAPYWNELVQIARNSLRSGNPNLIYPGESLQMPPIPA